MAVPSIHSLQVVARYAWHSLVGSLSNVCVQCVFFISGDYCRSEVFLTCTDVHLETEPNDWDTDIEIADGSYSLEGFEVELDYGPQGDA